MRRIGSHECHYCGSVEVYESRATMAGASLQLPAAPVCAMDAASSLSPDFGPPLPGTDAEMSPGLMGTARLRVPQFGLAGYLE